jgi:predicted GNAT family N-acyltransferase
MAELLIQEAAYGSPLYQQTVLLRDEILRKPLGMTLAPEELYKDKTSRHIAVLAGEKVVACLVLDSLTEKTVKVRQVAVAEGRQGSGVGKKLMLWTEGFCRSLGFNNMTLNSRETAVGFYEKLGYKKVGQPFIEATLPHHAMEKQI